MLAHALAASGIRSLRYDKRGIGASQSKMAREEDRASTTTSMMLRRRRGSCGRADIAGVVLIGHSEGGLVAIRAASRAPVKGLVLLAALGRPMESRCASSFSPRRYPRMRAPKPSASSIG